jgi:hypothetical protein
VASLDDAHLAPANSTLIKSLRTAADAVASANVERPQVFPNNFDYATYSTRERLEVYLDPANPLATIHPDDLAYFEGDSVSQKAYNLLKAVQDAAMKGFDLAPTIDHTAGTDEETKIANSLWHKTWEDLLGQFERKIEKGACAVGYRVAKRLELEAAGQLEEFFVCEIKANKVAGCQSHQYRNDACRNGISDYFGRNKKACRLIACMPIQCRKDYQTLSYNDEAWQLRKKNLIQETIDRNEAAVQRDGKSRLTYEIKLRAQDEKRVVEVAMQKGNGDPLPNNRHPATLSVIQHIHRQYVGTGKTMAEAKDLAAFADITYKAEVAAWKEGKTAVDIKKNIKAKGPKYAEFQLIPEWDKLYTAAEIAAATDSTSLPGTPESEAMARRTPSSKRKKRDEDAKKEDGSPTTPSKKAKK